jgi:hypothetical protein
VTGYATEGWGELFLAEAGASAALAGLLFVAVSINLERIVALRSLPEAALGAIVVAGISFLLRAGGGLYWLVPGVAFSLVVAVVDAWVLLVEVVR